MKVVRPETSEPTGGTRTRTLTQTFMALLPTSREYVDGAAIVVLAAIAFMGFYNTFDSLQFFPVALLGVLLGMFASRLAFVLRWHWLLVVPLVVAEFFLLGSLLAFRDEAAFSALPTLASLQSLAQLLIGGWKDLLTTLPPVAGDGPYVGLPYVMGLVYGAVALPAARSRRPFLALLPPAGLLAAVILLGTTQASLTVPIGLGFVGVAFVWAAWRFRQRRRLETSGRSNRTQVALAAGMLAAALAGGFIVGGFLPGGDTPRLVLRTYVQPPVDAADFASPLVGFRQYSSQRLQRFYDKPLLNVSGAQAGALLRMGVMDDYSGLAWTATSGSGSEGFQRVGGPIPNVSAEDKQTLQVTVLPGYADPSSGLAMWVPSLGETASVSFAGPLAKSHSAGFRYNLSSEQGIVVDRFQATDQVTVVTAPYPTAPGADSSPGGTPTVTSDETEFLAAVGQKYLGSADTPWARLTALAAAFKSGSWTDGTITGETQYLPGHSQRRLLTMLNSTPLAGSDEQYAAVFGLLATQAGYPSRVVMGAAVPGDGVVKGKDIQAWVEVHTASGWVSIPPSSFIPDRDKHPKPQDQTVDNESQGKNVPPPNPARAPGSVEDLADSELSITAPPAPAWWERVLGVLAIIGPPLGVLALIIGGIIGAKTLRSQRRRTRGTPAHRVASGWRDVVDQARDLGITVPRGATRHEQSLVMGVPSSQTLALQTDVLVFGEHQPDADAVADYWRNIAATRADLRATKTRRRRAIGRLSLRSFLPERASSKASVGTTRRARRPARARAARNRGGS